MLQTEYISPRYKNIDTWPVHEASLAFWEAQMRAVASVKSALPVIEHASLDIAERLLHPQSRLVYVGAGSSGLLAMQDGMEMTQTFSWPLDRIVFMMAGGDKARLSPDGISEDSAEEAKVDVDKFELNFHDVVIAVAASGSTPYTLQIAKDAKQRKCLVIGIANNSAAPLFTFSDHAVFLPSGSEVVAGSTRLNAGTAQKTVLGILSSMFMMYSGHIVDGMMVSVTADNIKLEHRAIRIIEHIAEVEHTEAVAAMNQANGEVKKGVLIAMGCSKNKAVELLESYGGNLREAMSVVKSA